MLENNLWNFFFSRKIALNFVAQTSKFVYKYRNQWIGIIGEIEIYGYKSSPVSTANLRRALKSVDFEIKYTKNFVKEVILSSSTTPWKRLQIIWKRNPCVWQAKMSSSDLKATFPNPDAAGYVGFANLPNQVSFSKAMILLISFLIFTMCLTWVQCPYIKFW